MGISLSHERYEEIKRIVVDMFVKYNVCCMQVNGFELATKMGIKVVHFLQRQEGEISKNPIRIYPGDLLYVYEKHKRLFKGVPV